MAKVSFKYGSQTLDNQTLTDGKYTLPTEGKLMASNLEVTPVPELRDNTFTINGTYRAGSGYDGWGEIVVNVDTQSGNTPQSKTVAPSTATITVNPDTPTYNVLSDVTVEAVTTENLTAANIKSGVTVKVGSESDDDSIASINGTFTSDATAVAGELLNGKTAYVNGSKITGTIPTRTGVNITGATPSYNTSTKVVTVPVTAESGYYAGNTTVDISYPLGDLIPDFPSGTDEASDEHIQMGYHAYDDEGNVLEGTMPNLGDVTRTLQAGQSYQIPQGRFTNIASTITADTLANQTSDATASASDILNGQTAYVNGVKITGTMPNNGATGGTINTQGGTYTIPAGYTSGGTVTANLPVATKSADKTITASASGTATDLSTYLSGNYVVITPTANVNQNGYVTTGAVSSSNPVVIPVFQLV